MPSDMWELVAALITLLSVALALYAGVATAGLYWLWGSGRPYGVPIWPGLALGAAAGATVTTVGGLILRAFHPS